jgi:hypothetical protein
MAMPDVLPNLHQSLDREQRLTHLVEHRQAAADPVHGAFC